MGHICGGGIGGHDLICVIHIIDSPVCRNERGGREVAGVGETYSVLARDGQFGFHGNRKGFGGKLSAFQELALVCDGDMVLAGLSEDIHLFVGTVDIHLVCAGTGAYRPIVLSGAKEGNAKDDGLIDTSDRLAFDGDVVLNNGYFLAEHSWAGVVAA